MDAIKSKVKQTAPGLFQALSSSRDALVRVKELPGRVLHPWWRASTRRIGKFQDRYRGERCFVIGNGPSLKGMDLSPLKDEFTFGMNRIYLAFKEWGFETSFLVSVNDLVVEQCWEDFQGLSLPKFFSWRSHELLYPQGEPGEGTHFLYTTYTGRRFNTRIQSRFWEGATVSYVCLQLAYCMGFSEVFLIGVDHSFEAQGKANQTVVSGGDDPNHFSPEYFGKGFRWQLPDLETSELAYRLAQESYTAGGRKIWDATVGGMLDVFPKVDYYQLFD
ncbi:MAG: 6-hydroxymethylpterin diphosphokinase MptE-like protein [Anaerolineales bacterium]